MDQHTSPLDDALALLAPLTPVERARVLAAVLDRHNGPVLSALRVQAVHDATQAPNATYATVAAALGVSTSAVNKAVTQHRRAAAEAARE